jgi:hypothetical protein
VSSLGRNAEFAIPGPRAYHGTVGTTASFSDRRRYARLLAATVGVLLFASACVGRLGRPRDPFAGGTPNAAGTIQVEVENINFNDASVFVVRLGDNIRLGDVRGKGEGSFEVPWNPGLPLRLRVNLVGGRGCITPEISVDTGDRIWIRIPSETDRVACRVGKR